MSDYMPTTAEVRDAYSSESSDSRFANRAFDLWLAKYKAKIIAQAEERIIKLLIDKAIEWRTADLHQQANYLDFAIELIKGEKE